MLNRGTTAATGVPLQLEMDGRVVQTLTVNVEPGASASVTFAPLTITADNTRASVRLGTARSNRPTRWCETTSSTS